MTEDPVPEDHEDSGASAVDNSGLRRFDGRCHNLNPNPNPHPNSGYDALMAAAISGSEDGGATMVEALLAVKVRVKVRVRVPPWLRPC